jgi:hypothetical protein
MFKKNDYVLYDYDGDELISRIIEINGTKATIEVCLSIRRGEETLTDNMEVDISELKPIPSPSEVIFEE